MTARTDPARYPDIEVLPPWPGRHEQLADRSLFVRSVPGADGQPAVLVHGLGGASTNWTDLMGLLADRLDAVAPDLPGFGHSPPPADGDYGPAGHAQAVLDLIETQGRGPVHLMGNSLGGAVAVFLAATRPDLVRSLTLVSAALPDLRPRPAGARLSVLAVPMLGEKVLARMGAVGPESRVRETLELCFADPDSVPRSRFLDAVAEVRRRGELEHTGDALLQSLRGLLASYLAHGPMSLWALARRVTAPTLIVQGGRDRLVDPATARRAAAAIAGSTLLVLPDCGHVAQMEHPEIVAIAVRELLDRAA